MVKKTLLIACAAIAMLVVGAALLSGFSPNIVYLRSECAALSEVLSYRGPRLPIASTEARRLYFFRSAGDGSLQFHTIKPNAFSFGYLTSGVPQLFLIDFDDDCRMTAKAWIIP